MKRFISILLALLLSLLFASNVLAAGGTNYRFVFSSLNDTDKTAYIGKENESKQYMSVFPISYTDLKAGDKGQFWARNAAKEVITKKSSLTLSNFSKYSMKWNYFDYTKKIEKRDTVQYGGKCIKFSGSDFAIYGEWTPN